MLLSPRTPGAAAWSSCLRWSKHLFFGACLATPSLAATESLMVSFERDALPVLDQFCYDCHGYGSDKGGVVLDGFEDEAALRDHALWLRVLKNVRSHIMPPADKPQPSEDEVASLIRWIKRDAFALDPSLPDPGRVTVRRLNRVEYRNTIRELLGVDYNTAEEFPADDTGHGFDNIGDVLSISPMLLEKYLDAAQTVVAEAVPTRSRVVAEAPIPGRDFAVVSSSSVDEAASSTEQTSRLRPAPKPVGSALDLSYYTPALVRAEHAVNFAGRYQLVVDFKAVERYVDDQFDYNRCRLIVRDGDEVLMDQEFVRQSDKSFQFTFDREWTAGTHAVSVEIVPVGEEQPQPRLLRIRLQNVTVRGPFDERHWVAPKNYAKFFPRPVPESAEEKRNYARELLSNFALRAFRRPADADVVERLVTLAERASSVPDGTFESGIAQSMVATLASPRFIFREEGTEALRPGQAHPFVDEYALASRLSYFLWSSMPDEELFRLAGEGKLRANLAAQVDRMLNDPRSQEFVRNFTGQWLQARDIETVPINAFDVYLRENPRPDVEEARETFRSIVSIPDENRTPEQREAFAEARRVFLEFLRAPKPDLTDPLRSAMRRESELVFEYVIRNDRSLLELIDANYTFLNEALAKHYDVPGVEGPEMRLVTLPEDSPRGGVLTQGTVLAVTSNPTRTSPVKRGVFILEAILGTPPAPPPPNIPPLENAAGDKLSELSLRETMALHAKNKMCASCHSRMDPLGLALENFNALGKFRTAELNQPIQPEGKLITGEAFTNIRELKRILATGHRHDFYHSISEKLLTYALGRGLDYRDTDTLDRLVEQLEASGGKPSVLLRGIINAAPFQQRRADDTSLALDSVDTAATHIAQSAPQP